MLKLVRRVSTANSTGESPFSENARSNSVASVDGDGKRRSSIGRSGSSFSTKFGESLKSVKSRGKDGRSKSISEEPSSEVQASLGTLFFALPTELQVQILIHLPIPDLLAARLACRRLSQLMSVNQSALVRGVARSSFPSYCFDLYPLHQQTHRYARQHLPYLIRLRHRLVVSKRLADLIAKHIEVEVMRCTTPARKQAFQEDRKRITEKMVCPIFIIYHFYEKLREWMLEHAKEPDGEWHMPQEILASWTWTLFKKYESQDLVDANHMHKLLVSTFSRLLRPPSYATGPERIVRGWSATPPSEAALAATLAVGGVEQVKTVLAISSYSAKCKAVDSFLKNLTPKNTIKWRKNWAVLIDGPFYPVFGMDPPERLRHETFGAMWSPWCTNFLVHQKVIDDEDEVKTQKEYISELLEYDVLRGTRWQSLEANYGTNEDVQASDFASTNDDEHDDDDAGHDSTADIATSNHSNGRSDEVEDAWWS